MAIRAVVFDIGGVLEINEAMTFRERWSAQLGLSVEEIGGRLAEVWAAGAVGTMTEEAVYQAVGARLDVGPDSVIRLMAEMWVQYLGTGNTELIEYAGSLRPRYRTGILTNSFVGAREREQERYGFEELVDELVYSDEAGTTKPDPEIYRLICTRLGVAPEETVLLDDAEENVTGARAVGLHAVRYRANEQAIGEIDAMLVDEPG